MVQGRLVGDSLSVEERAVGALHVAEPNAVVALDDCAVQLTDSVAGRPKVAGLISADHKLVGPNENLSASQLAASNNKLDVHPTLSETSRCEEGVHQERGASMVCRAGKESVPLGFSQLGNPT
jgi:hypothetical protein